MLGELQAVLTDKGITFRYGDDLLDYLVSKSYSVTYGARNLRRQIQKDLEDPIATKIIESYAYPLSGIAVSVEEDKLVLSTI